MIFEATDHSSWILEPSLKVLIYSLTKFHFYIKRKLIKRIFFFRDTGISLQIQLYQLYSEIFVFLTYNVSVVLFLFFNPIDTIFAREGIILPVAQFIVYVVQPLFYLHGDPSFRQSCLNLGTWNALKRALQKPTFE